MSCINRRRYAMAAAGVASVVIGLYSLDSTASKSFTMAMEESARQDWDKAFNKVLAEPFAKLECAPGQKNTLSLGSGCVDVGQALICCSGWAVGTKCTAEHKWQQTNIEGTDCERKPIPK